MNMDLFRECYEPLEKVLRDSRISKSNVDEFVLVGGSTRIPKIREILIHFFDGKAPNDSINPDFASAQGAAIMAAIKSRHSSEKLREFLLLDVVVASLGVEISGGVMATLIKCRTTVPCKKSHTFTSSRDGQTSALIKIYEGDCVLTKENKLVGWIQL